MATDTKQLQKQLPEFVSQGSALTELFTLDAEHLTTITIDRLDTFEQMFVEHGTWGLKFWEIFLGISVDANLSLEVRRAAIKSKIQASHTLTLGRLKLMFEAFGYTVVEILEDNLQYKVQVRTANAPKDYPELMVFAKALQVVFPAHLDLVVISEEEVAKVTVDVDELGQPLITPNEEFLYVLGESITATDYYNQLSKVYKYDANTLAKISVFDYGLTYNSATTPGWKIYKTNSAISDAKIFIEATQKYDTTKSWGSAFNQHLAVIDLLNNGAIAFHDLHTLLGEPYTFAMWNGTTAYNNIQGLKVHYDTNDDYLYLIYYVGDYSYLYANDSDTRKWYVARFNPVTLALISKTLIPKTTHVNKIQFIDPQYSYPWFEKTTWYSDCYGENVQIVRGIDGDYLVFFDRQVQYKELTTQPPPNVSPTVTTWNDLYRKNSLVQLMSLSALSLSTITTPDVNEYARRFGRGGGWLASYKDSKTNMSRYFGIPIHFPSVFTASAGDRVDSVSWAENQYSLMTIDPVSHELIVKYDIPGNNTTFGWSDVYWNQVPKNTTEDMSIWMHSSLNPDSSFARNFKYGTTLPKYPDSRPYTWYAYPTVAFGALRYPFKPYESGGIESWEQELVTDIEVFDAAGSQDSATFNNYKPSNLYTAQNNSNLVFYMYDTRSFGTLHYDSYSNSNIALTNLPARIGRQLVRTPERLYKKFRLWSLLNY